MKIDMAKATTEWLEEWVSNALKSKETSLYANNISINDETAKTHYLLYSLNFYISGSEISKDKVIIFADSLSADDTKMVQSLEMIVENGSAVFESINPEMYYEPYCTTPNCQLVITFSVPTK